MKRYHQTATTFHFDFSLAGLHPSWLSFYSALRNGINGSSVDFPVHGKLEIYDEPPFLKEGKGDLTFLFLNFHNYSSSRDASDRDRQLCNEKMQKNLKSSPACPWISRYQDTAPSSDRSFFLTRPVHIFFFKNLNWRGKEKLTLFSTCDFNSRDDIARDIAKRTDWTVHRKLRRRRRTWSRRRWTPWGTEWNVLVTIYVWRCLCTDTHCCRECCWGCCRDCCRYVGIGGSW